jgi:predicted ribonuclease YlaK
LNPRDALPLLGYAQRLFTLPQRETERCSSIPKTYVLDTNVLLHNPRAIFSFEDNHVVIPLAVIEEVDNQKMKGEAIAGHITLVKGERSEVAEMGARLL